MPALDVLMTGAYYDGMADLLPEAGHMMMLEQKSTGVVSARILDWLQERDAN